MLQPDLPQIWRSEAHDPLQPVSFSQNGEIINGTFVSFQGVVFFPFVCLVFNTANMMVGATCCVTGLTGGRTLVLSAVCNTSPPFAKLFLHLFLTAEVLI